MTTEEAQKINDLYNQIDVLTAENVVLKEQIIHYFDSHDNNNSAVLDRLNDLEVLVKDVACKCDKVSKK